MLRRLTLRDLVIVAELEVEFGPGLSVLTGETGAGKSILVDALQLALGGRGDAGLVREGAARAEVAALFDLPAALRDWLETQGLAPGDDELLLRRTLDTQGKSRAWINGSVATLAQLRELGEALVDIHGQHAWQSLARPASVRALVDAWAGVDDAGLEAAWDAWRAALAERDAARARQATLAGERERLAWQLGEVERLAPAEGEWDELEAEHKRLAHAQALLDGVAQAQAGLEGGDDGERGGALAALAAAAECLQPLVAHDPRLAPVVEQLAEAQVLARDAAHALGGYLQRVELDPARLAALDDRLAAWLALARRLRCRPDELPAAQARWRRELAALDAASDGAALDAACARARQAYDRVAEQARAARRRAAPRLAAEVTRRVQSLGMAGAAFEVALVDEAEPHRHGLESIELRVAGHAGAAPRPLAKVASGGELSRLALAVAATTAACAHAAPATLVFDEVDAGIGGATAHAVGRMMKQLGARHQVLAVTHLAQVAAHADHHHAVGKHSAAGRPAATLATLDAEARAAEIARMLGGSQSAQAVAHARELLAHATQDGA